MDECLWCCHPLLRLQQKKFCDEVLAAGAHRLELVLVKRVVEGVDVGEGLEVRVTEERG